MDGDSLLSVLQQKLLSHPDYTQITHKLKCDVQAHPTRHEQRALLSALSKYDKENKLVTSVQKCLLSLEKPSINEAASQALAALIAKDHSTAFVLHQFLNQTFPGPLRAALWQVVLGDGEVGERYKEAVRDKKYSTLSPQEGVIREKCSALTHTATSLNTMVTALSYWHIHVGRPLTEIDYCLTLPLLSVGTEVPQVVSMLSGLHNLQSRLKGTENGTINIVVQYVQSALPDLGEHLITLRPDLGNTANTGTASHHNNLGNTGNHGNTGPYQLIAPLHSKLFVGYLSHEVVCFMLDQCVIGADLAGYNPLFAFTASILCLLDTYISQCTNVSLALSQVQQRGPTLTVKQIQLFIQDHYIDSLSTQLSTKARRIPHQKDAVPNDAGLHKEIEELKAKLSEEKKQRNDKHVAFRNEIAHLRAENEDLKIKLKQRPAAVAAAVVAPVHLPLKPATPDPPPAPPTPPPAEDEDTGDISGPLEAPLRPKQVETLWLDIGKCVIQRVKRLAFKNPTRKRELDNLTHQLNKMYEQDRLAAEEEVFGRVMTPEEWDTMEEQLYFDNIHKLDVVIDRIARARYAVVNALHRGKK